MARVRFLAATLLGLAGSFYVAEFMCGLDSVTIFTVLFGAVCLVVTTLMLDEVRFADHAAGIMALLALWVAQAGGGRIFLPYTLALMTLSCLAAAGCIWLVFRDWFVTQTSQQPE